MPATAADSELNNTNSSDDPYFLHHSDGPRLVLVSQTLTGDNYTSWSRAMLIALSVKNKIDFIDGSLVCPNPSDQASFKAWNRNNNVVISWILNSVSKEISANIIFLDTAFEMWKELKERFQQGNEPRIFQIKRDIMNLTQGEDSVSNYFTKLKVIWEELANYNVHCTCGKCICGGAKDIEHTMSFLMGLNDSYSQIRGQILLMDPIPSVNKIFSLVVQEERQRSIGNSTTSSTVAFNVRSTSGYQGNKNYRKDSPFCTHCKKPGHTQDKCYRLHGFPPGYRNQNRNFNEKRTNSVQADTVDSSSINEVITGLTQSQCEQLIFAISGKMASVNHVTTASGKYQGAKSESEVLSQSCPDQADYVQENDWQG